MQIAGILFGFKNLKTGEPFFDLILKLGVMIDLYLLFKVARFVFTKKLNSNFDIILIQSQPNYVNTDCKPNID